MRRNFGTIETTPASRAFRLGPTGESDSDAFDFMEFEFFGHRKRKFSCLLWTRGTDDSPNSNGPDSTLSLRRGSIQAGGDDEATEVHRRPKTRRCSTVGRMLSSVVP